ncbi:hypothetical protein G9A89_008448 [Geosiphon pyriformis]|nr:hypothetical protein G9A89_008448 [Geosiphon pyriformis]
MPNTYKCIDGNWPLHLIIDIDARQKPDPSDSKLSFLDKEPIKQESQPIDNENILVEEANLVIAKYKWLQIGRTEKRFINFEAQSVKECPICDIKYNKNQLYGFIQKNEYFILKYYCQKQYKPDYKGLSFNKVSNKVESKEKPKWGLIKRLPNAVKHPHPLVELSEKIINVKKMKDAPKAYPDFLCENLTTTLICSSVASSKTKTLREILDFLAKNRANLPCFN